MALHDFRQELTCCICTGLYTDPVTLRCGHNFCRPCITRTWNNQEDREYSCPECRMRFIQKPELTINVRLRNLVERIQANQPKIFCSNCTPDSPDVAYKSCLLCEVSLCKYHFDLHIQASDNHLLTEPTPHIEKRVCFTHKKILELYCCDDKKCVCESCHQDGEHKGHKVESLSEASIKKKENLQNVLPGLIASKVRISERLKLLESQNQKLQEKASGTSMRSNSLFRDTRKKIKEIENSIQTAISKQKEKTSHRHLEAIQQLAAEQDELFGHIDSIKELTKCDDPLTILQDKESNKSIVFQATFGDMDVCEMDDQEFQIVMDLTEDQISAMFNLCLANVLAFVRGTVCKNRASGDMILDVDTAGDYVCISDDKKTASWSQLSQNRPDTLTKFEGANQVMSTWGFSSGLQHLDVEASQEGVWIIGMSYPSIDRAEYESFIGLNKKSWALCKSDNQYSVKHDSREITLRQKISSGVFRVCVDYERGQLSFYKMSHPIKLLHTFTATFTEPLYAIFSVWGKGKVTIQSST